MRHVLTLVQSRMASASVGSKEAPCTPRKAVSFAAPLPTTPFNQETENDPWEFFPEWQYPNSAMRDDTKSYDEEYRAALLAERNKARTYGSPLPLAKKQELAQLSLRCGPFEAFRTPTRPRRQRPSLQSVPTDEQAHSHQHEERPSPSPMKVDTPSYKKGLRGEQEYTSLAVD